MFNSIESKTEVYMNNQINQELKTIPCKNDLLNKEYIVMLLSQDFLNKLYKSKLFKYENNILGPAGKKYIDRYILNKYCLTYVDKIKNIINELNSREFFEQKSIRWHLERQTMLTATDSEKIDSDSQSQFYEVCLKKLKEIEAQPPSNSPFQDLNGNAGPQFDTGTPSQVHADPNQKTPTELVANYTSKVNPDANYGNSQWPVVPAVNQDLDGLNGPGFNKGETSKLQQDSLANIYQSTINPGASYGAGQPKGTWPSVNPSTLDLNGNPGQLFNKGISSTLKQDLLANVYQSGVNPGASYGAGQPGGTWPSINPSPLASTPFADLNGNIPSQYLNNLPG